MKYRVRITRVSYSHHTYGIDANSPEEAMEDAMGEAMRDCWDEDDYEFLDDIPPEEITEEEFQEEFGELITGQKNE